VTAVCAGRSSPRKLVAAKPDNQYKIREIDGGEQD
jgi:hypothetical protein